MTTQDSLVLAIIEAEKELDVRIIAGSHLRGIPRIQNQTAIDRLYDALNALHIQRLEAAL